MSPPEISSETPGADPDELRGPRYPFRQAAGAGLTGVGWPVRLPAAILKRGAGKAEPDGPRSITL